jgi:hypothetical protein
LLSTSSTLYSTQDICSREDQLLQILRESKTKDITSWSKETLTKLENIIKPVLFSLQADFSPIHVIARYASTILGEVIALNHPLIDINQRCPCHGKAILHWPDCLGAIGRFKPLMDCLSSVHLNLEIRDAQQHSILEPCVELCAKDAYAHFSHANFRMLILHGARIDLLLQDETVSKNIKLVLRRVFPRTLEQHVIQGPHNNLAENARLTELLQVLTDDDRDEIPFLSYAIGQAHVTLVEQFLKNSVYHPKNNLDIERALKHGFGHVTLLIERTKIRLKDQNLSEEDKTFYTDRLARYQAIRKHLIFAITYPLRIFQHQVLPKVRTQWFLDIPYEIFCLIASFIVQAPIAKLLYRP